MRALGALVLLLCFTGCAGRSLGLPGSGDCEGVPPRCPHGCGSDWLGTPACQDGQWVCPEGTTSESECPMANASFVWSEAFGVAGTGRRIEIGSAGHVRGWYHVSGVPTRTPDYEDHLPGSDVTQLFAAWHQVRRDALPHPRMGFAECSIMGVVSDRPDAVPVQLDYGTPDQVLPEMQSVWDWFDGHARGSISVADFNPAFFCSWGE